MPVNPNEEKQACFLLGMSHIIDYIDDHVMITDKNGIIEYVNQAFEKTTGYSCQEIKGKTPNILKSGLHDSQYYRKLWTTILKGKVFSVITVNKKKNGDFYHAEQIITPIKNEANQITHFVSVWRDVTERIKSEQALALLHDQLKFEKSKLEQIVALDERLGIIHNLNELIDFVVDRTTGILEAEKCSLMFVDESLGELAVRGYKGLNKKFMKGKRLRIGDPIAGIVAQEGKPILVADIETDMRFSRKNRPTYKSKSFMSVPIKLGENLIGVISVADKKNHQSSQFNELDLRILCMITRQAAVAIENAKLYRQLNYLTVTDPITNIYNYRYFVRTLDSEISRINRYGGSLCILMLDVDNFKEYNDAYGHLEGDYLLKAIANILVNNLRQIDVACRYAGDEFVVILPHTAIDKAVLVGKKIMKQIAQLKLKKNVTVSIGVAKHIKGKNRYELILQADSMLYQAKKKGKKSICSMKS